MKYLYIIIGAALFSCTSCTDREVVKTRISAGSTTVEIIPASDTLKLSAYFKSCDYLELKGMLLAEIIDVRLVDDLILVQSKAQNTDIHVFSNEGNYLRSLIRYGRAGNEVLNMQAFCYNEGLQTIDVLCNYGMEIKRYSLDGDCRSTITLPKESVVSARDIEVIDESTYVLYKDVGYTDSLEYKLYVYDFKRDSVINTFIPFDREIEEKISFGQNNNLYRNDGTVCFYEVFQNGIFELDKDSIKPYAAFEENRYTLPSEIFSTSRDQLDLINYCRQSNYIWAHRNCYQCNDLIFSFFTYAEKIYGNMIDMAEQQARSFSYIHDDLHFNTLTPIQNFNVIGTDRGRFICSLRHIVPEEYSYLLFLYNN